MMKPWFAIAMLFVLVWTRGLKAADEHRAFLQLARERARTSKATDKAVAARDGTNVLLSNKHVCVRISQTNSAWDVAWLGKADAAVEHVDFALEWNGAIAGLASTPIKTASFESKLGLGTEARQKTSGEVQIERTLRVYDGKPIVTLSAAIANRSKKEVSLGTARLVNLFASSGGRFHLGTDGEVPAAIQGVSGAHWSCTPWQPSKKEETYGSGGLLALAERKPPVGFAIGFLSARQARPDLSTIFRAGEGGTQLLAHQPLLGRTLGPGESIEFDTVYLAANVDPFIALEQYADVVASNAPDPIRNKPSALWCSWYAHRMDVSEDLVLANGAAAAKYFKPLGFEIMQIDHGWQLGDVTGNWVPNERFPHGLKWLVNELKSRYGFRLGLWIAPTDVAETSEVFRQHPDWMLKDGAGKPLVNWKWYWKPNPDCYELDASRPEVQKYIADTFARLSSEGASYFKIDFIAASAGEQFVQANPKVTRGWGVFERAIDAVRKGAGPDATIRYCQVPSLLAAGVADSALGGGDTLDAGLNGNIAVLRENAQRLAAGYWANGRLYRREVCDMSVRMQADVEEARLRLAMMTLAGCSISFSDELQHLPLSRIRMMQSCLPPGNPAMKPLDLFERSIPSIWHIHCRNAADEWDVVGLFNFEGKPEERTIDLAALGLGNSDAACFEFWEQKFLGVQHAKLSLTLPPQTSRIFSIRRLSNHPQLIGTDLHLLQGYHELKKLEWNEKTQTLSGEVVRMPGIPGKLFIYVPTTYAAHFDFPLTEKSAHLTRINERVWAHEFEFETDRHAWRIPFDKKDAGGAH